jgi:hypothetical protein
LKNLVAKPHLFRNYGPHPSNPTVRTKQCGHFFHINYLLSWLTEFPTCPNCCTRLFNGRTRDQRVAVLQAIVGDLDRTQPWWFTEILQRLTEEEESEFRSELVHLSVYNRQLQERQLKEERIRDTAKWAAEEAARRQLVGGEQGENMRRN